MAVYRTRMAIADGGELIVLAPGVDHFGEDPAIDRLIRKYGYCGRLKVLEQFRAPENQDLRDNMGAAAHLIHGSSDGRFSITYAVRPHITREEIEGVHFKWADYDEMAGPLRPAQAQATATTSCPAARRSTSSPTPRSACGSTAPPLPGLKAAARPRGEPVFARRTPHVCARRGGPIQSAGGLQASNTFFCGNGMAFAMRSHVLSGFRFARSRGQPLKKRPRPKGRGSWESNAAHARTAWRLPRRCPGGAGEAPARP